MTAKSGALVLIKAGNGGDPEIFTTIGGLRTSQITINQELLDASNLESGAWQKLLANAGMRSLRMSGSGIYTNSVSENTLRGYAFSGSAHHYQFIFAGGSVVSGAFIIISYQSSGDFDDVETYEITLQSAGTISFSGI